MIFRTLFDIWLFVATVLIFCIVIAIIRLLCWLLKDDTEDDGTMITKAMRDIWDEELQ